MELEEFFRFFIAHCFPIPNDQNIISLSTRYKRNNTNGNCANTGTFTFNVGASPTFRVNSLTAAD